MSIAFTYALLAAIAIGINLASQEISLLLYAGPYAMTLAVIAGTGTGLVSKYWLDKRYIFYFRPVRKSDDFFTFLRYTATGGLNTLLFWGFEFGMEYLFANKPARYSGAVIGLILGYYLKYQMDKRLVFTESGAGAR